METLLVFIFSFTAGAVSLVIFQEWQHNERRKHERLAVAQSEAGPLGAEDALTQLKWCESQITQAQWELLERRLGSVTPPPPTAVPPVSLASRVLASGHCLTNDPMATTTGRISLCCAGRTDSAMPLLAKNRARLLALGFVVTEDGKEAVYDAAVLQDMLQQQLTEEKMNKAQ